MVKTIKHFIISSALCVVGYAHADPTSVTEGRVIYDDIFKASFVCTDKTISNVSCQFSRDYAYLDIKGWARISDVEDSRMISETTAFADHRFQFYDLASESYSRTACIQAINLVKAYPEKWDLYISIHRASLHCEAINQNTALKYYTESTSASF